MTKHVVLIGVLLLAACAMQGCQPVGSRAGAVTDSQQSSSAKPAAPQVVGLTVGEAFGELLAAGTPVTVLESGAATDVPVVLSQGAGRTATELTVSPSAESSAGSADGTPRDAHGEQLFVLVALTSDNQAALASYKEPLQRYLQTPPTAVQLDEPSNWTDGLPGPYALIAAFKNESVANRSASYLAGLGFQPKVLSLTRANAAPVSVNEDVADQ